MLNFWHQEEEKTFDLILKLICSVFNKIHALLKYQSVLQNTDALAFSNFSG
jgi:hypothetical protein